MDPDLLLPNRVLAQAAATPDRILVHEVDGASHTYAQVVDLACRWSDAFAAAGVEPGDNVLTMVHPSATWLAAWLGLSQVHGVDTGVNVDYRGAWLHGAIERSNARLLVVSEDLVPHLTREVLDGTAVERIVVEGPGAQVPTLPRPAVRHVEFLEQGLPGVRSDVQPWDTAYMVLTSGTTGPSKYVIVPWALAYQGSMGLFGPGELGPDDVLYSPLPVYHVAARYLIYRLALAGGSVVLRKRVSVSGFWDDVRKYDCTVALTIGYARLLLAQAPTPQDRQHRLHWSIQAPVIPEHETFTERFGTFVRSAFGMSEIGIPIAFRGDTPPNPTTCGRVLDEGHTGFQVSLVDEHDNPVPVGEVGELVVRTAEPWALTTGYYGMPEETARAWRNGWFHTGDGFRVDEAGWFYFVDRMKDAIRRRGQNISSFEIEAAVNSNPRVLESAAVAHRGDDGDEELRLFVVRSDEALTAEELAEELERSLPRFMVPDHIELVEALPKTAATLRIRKKELRERPLGPKAWARRRDAL